MLKPKKSPDFVPKVKQEIEVDCGWVIYKTSVLSVSRVRGRLVLKVVPHHIYPKLDYFYVSNAGTWRAKLTVWPRYADVVIRPPGTFL